MSELLTTSFNTDIVDVRHEGDYRTSDGASTGTPRADIYDKKVKEDISEEITLIDPDKFPFIRFLEVIKSKKTADNYKYQWLEEDNKAIKTTMKAGTDDVQGSATSTKLYTNADNLFVAGHVLRLLDVSAGTSEIVEVLSKDASDTYTVKRGASGTTALATFANSDEVIRVGTNFAENTGAADPDHVEPDWLWNLTQNFKMSVEISGRMDAMKVVGRASEINWQLQSRMKDFNEDVEGAFLVGNRHHGTDRKTYTGGLQYFIENYAPSGNTVNAATKTFNQLYLDSLANNFFRYGSKKKLALIGGQVMSKITTFQLPYLRENKKTSDALGVAVTDYISPHGTLSLVHSRWLDESLVYSKWMYIIDEKYVSKRFLPGRDTQINMNVHDNDQDGKKHQIMADIGLEIRNPAAFHLVKNIDDTINS
jgi:hypothetical protein